MDNNAKKIASLGFALFAALALGTAGAGTADKAAGTQLASNAATKTAQTSTAKSATKKTARPTQSKATQAKPAAKASAKRPVKKPSATPYAAAAVAGGLAAGTLHSDVLDKIQETKTLPPEVLREAKVAKLNLNDLSIVAVPLNGEGNTLFFNAHTPRIPASIEKIVTAALAFSRMGPAKVWSTLAVAEDEPRDGVVEGDLYLIGHGDPYLSIERFWLLVDNLYSRGIREIKGNVVVDRSYFDVPKHDSFAFDGEGNRPYNLGPDAMLLNSRSLIIKIRPDAKAKVAKLYAEPALSTISIPESVPLVKGGCGAWRKQLKPDYSNPYKPVFNGTYPSSCGSKDLLYTVFDQNEYVKAVFYAMWRQLGGKWEGSVVSGTAPQERQALASSYSMPLTQIAYNMNKYSNNLIARQLFLSSGKTAKGEPKTLEASRNTLREWTDGMGIPEKEIYLDNGSGLSRASRLSAYAAAKVLENMWNSPYMPEFMSSLPVSGVDGTMKKRHAADGHAHIKTGYISSVRSIAGYVLSKSGRRYAVVAIVNGPGALGSVPVLDSIIKWIYTDC